MGGKPESVFVYFVVRVVGCSMIVTPDQDKCALIRLLRSSCPLYLQIISSNLEFLNSFRFAEPCLNSSMLHGRISTGDPTLNDPHSSKYLHTLCTLKSSSGRAFLTLNDGTLASGARSDWQVMQPTSGCRVPWPKARCPMIVSAPSTLTHKGHI